MGNQNISNFTPHYDPRHLGHSRNFDTSNDTGCKQSNKTLIFKNCFRTERNIGLIIKHNEFPESILINEQLQRSCEVSGRIQKQSTGDSTTRFHRFLVHEHELGLYPGRYESVLWTNKFSTPLFQRLCDWFRSHSDIKISRHHSIIKKQYKPNDLKYVEGKFLEIDKGEGWK